MKTGVIIARFQVSSLHKGHIHLIEEVIKKCDKLVIVLGSPSIPNDRNILPMWVRGGMIQDFMNEYYPGFDFMIHEIRDHHENSNWSKSLDNILSLYKEITLYGSRDSFISFYDGEHKHTYVSIPELVGVSGTNDRENMNYTNNEDFRKGIFLGYKLFKLSKPWEK